MSPDAGTVEFLRKCLMERTLERENASARVRELEAALRTIKCNLLGEYSDIDQIVDGCLPPLPCAWDRCDTPSHCAQRGACRNHPVTGKGKLDIKTKGDGK